MPGIRVPDAQYEAPTPTPEQAQVPMPRQPVANANMFGAAQATAGEQAGAKVEGAAVDVADRIIQQKMWIQQANLYEDKEGLRASQIDILHNDRTKTVIDPDTKQPIQIPDGLLDRTGKWATGISAEYSQRMQDAMQANSPKEPELLELNKTRQRLFGSVYAGGLSSVSDWESRQQKAYVTNTLTASTADDILAGKEVMNIPDLNNVLHRVSDSSMKQGANAGLPPDQIKENQEKAYAQTVRNATLGKVTKGIMTPEDAKAMVSSVSGYLNPKDTDDINNAINKSYDVYQKQSKINQEHAQGDAVQEFSSGVGSGKYNATNANAILADKNLPANVAQALYNAVMNVNSQRKSEIETINKGGTIGKTVPVTASNLGVPLLGDKNQEAADTAKYTLDIANTLNTKDATDKLVTAITSDKLDKTQLEVYTRTLALVGQYAPTETEHTDGKTIDPKGAPQIAALKTVAEYAKDKPGGTSLIKNYLDGIQTPNADPTAALTGAMRTHALQINPKLANIPEGGITATDKYGNRRMIFPDLHTESIKKSSGGMNVPNSSSK